PPIDLGHVQIPPGAATTIEKRLHPAVQLAECLLCRNRARPERCGEQEKPQAPAIVATPAHITRMAHRLTSRRRTRPFYSSTTAVPLTDTISIPFSLPSTSWSMSPPTTALPPSAVAR